MADINKPLSLRATHLFKGKAQDDLPHNTPVALDSNAGGGCVRVQTLNGKVHIVPREELHPLQG